MSWDSSYYMFAVSIVRSQRFGCQICEAQRFKCQQCKFLCSTWLLAVDFEWTIIHQRLCVNGTLEKFLWASRGRSPVSPLLSSAPVCVDAGGTRGGILTAWDVHALSLKGFIARKHTLTTVLVSTVTDISFTVTNVYGLTTAILHPFLRIWQSLFHT